MDNNILDRMDWDENEHFNADNEETSDSGVIMIKTFNTEEEAQVCAAALKNEGIDAHVISSTTSGMTPFAYGNIRLFVAVSQEEEAHKIIQRLATENAVFSNPQDSAVHILVIIAIGLVIISILLYLVQKVFSSY
jgi:hypothetical protein